MEYEALKDGTVVARGFSKVSQPRHAVVGWNAETGRYWWVGAYYHEEPASRAALKQHQGPVRGLVCGIRLAPLAT